MQRMLISSCRHSAFQNIRENQEIGNAISGEFLFSTYYFGIKKYNEKMLIKLKGSQPWKHCQ